MKIFLNLIVSYLLPYTLLSLLCKNTMNEKLFPPSRLVSLDLLLDLLHCLHLKCCLGRGAEDREVTVPKGRVRGGVGADCKTASTSQPDLSRLKTLTPAPARRLGAEKTSPKKNLGA